MATPLQQIRDGIATANWDLVCKGYEGMTGEAMYRPAQDGGGSWQETVMEIHQMCNKMVQAPPSPPKKTKLVKATVKMAAKTASPPKPAEPEAEVEPEPVAVAPPQINTDGQKKETETVTESPYEKFKVVHNVPDGTDEDGRKKSTPLPFEPGMTNKFKDDKTTAMADREFDKKALPVQPSERRPEFKYISVTCCRCSTRYNVHPDLAPRSVEAGDEIGSFICNNCIGKVQR